MSTKLATRKTSKQIAHAQLLDGLRKMGFKPGKLCINKDIGEITRTWSVDLKAKRKAKRAKQ